MVDHLQALTQEYQGADVTVEVVSREFGDNYEAERMPLGYIEYDKKDDVVIIAVGGRDGRYPVVFRHIVEQPQKILVDTLADGVLALDILAADGTQTIVTLRRRDDGEHGRAGTG